MLFTAVLISRKLLFQALHCVKAKIVILEKSSCYYYIVVQCHRQNSASLSLLITQEIQFTKILVPNEQQQKQ